MSSNWIEFSLEGAIVQTDRHAQIVSQLQHPDRQAPNLGIFLGRQQKDAALRYFAVEKGGTLRDHRSIGLHLVDASAKTLNPWLVADCDIFDRGAQIETTPSVLIPLLAECIFGFADYVCLFSDDYDECLRLESLLINFPREAKGTAPRPALIVVSQNLTATGLQSIFNHDVRLQHVFSEISFVKLPDSRVSSAAGRFSVLRRSIQASLRKCRAVRAREYLLFTAKHQYSLLSTAIHKFDEKSVFDFISAVRFNFPTVRWLSHIETFLRAALHRRVPYETIRKTVASCLVMNAFPVGMHMFAPSAVFQRLYQSDCVRACQSVFDSLHFADEMSRGIEQTFLHQASCVHTGVHSSQIRNHEAILAGRYLQMVKSNTTCFGCLANRPEHVLFYGHAICDDCVQIFGRGVIGQEHYFVVKRLSTEEVRGVIPLETLVLLQETLGAECDLQDFIDYAIGTSAGGLIVLGMFTKPWSVQKTKDTFKDFTKKFFKTQHHDVSLIHNVKRFFKSVIDDYVYDVKDLERELIELFGQNTYLFQGFSGLTSGTKIAVTAATDIEPTARLLTNYNGSDAIDASSGYQIVRPPNVDDEPRVWQAARATSAVPILFPSIEIHQNGVFWDGAFTRHNNPVNLALWESQRIWSMNEPDVVISLGTGLSSDKTAEKKVHNVWDLVKSRGLPKLWSSLMSFLEGEAFWKDLHNHLNDKSRLDYFRFNFPIEGGPPALNDASSMNLLSELVRDQSNHNSSFTEAISALIASAFFFELSDQPVRQNTNYHCRGTIRCRFRYPTSLLQAMKKLFPPPGVAFMNGSTSLGQISSETDICRGCGRFAHEVEVTVASMDIPLQISIGLVDAQCDWTRRISSMPKSAAWFMEQQQLQAPFGSSNHGAPGALRCARCENATVKAYKASTREVLKRKADPTPVKFSKRLKETVPIVMRVDTD